MRGKPGIKCWSGSVQRLREHAKSLGHTPGRGRAHYSHRYLCLCETCGAEIRLQRSKVRDGYRMLPLGECPEFNNFKYGWGI